MPDECNHREQNANTELRCPVTNERNGKKIRENGKRNENEKTKIRKKLKKNQKKKVQNEGDKKTK